MEVLNGEEKDKRGGKKSRLMVLLEVCFVPLSDVAAEPHANVSALTKTRFGPVYHQHSCINSTAGKHSGG